jgi:hypothetical protein
MKLQVVGNTNPNTWCRCFVGTRAQITAANLPNGSVTICTDEAENGIDLNVVYPVGSIYQNATNDANPAVLFGVGTWSLIDSAFLFGCNSLMTDLGDTGGNSSVTLTQANLPSSLDGMVLDGLTASASTESTDHTHTITIENGGSSALAISGTTSEYNGTASISGTTSTEGGSTQVSGTTGNVSGSGATWTHSHGIYSVEASTGGTSEKSIETKARRTETTSGVVKEADLQHTHDFTATIDTSHSHTFSGTASLTHSHTFSTTADISHTHTASAGAQSERASHSHTITIASQTIGLTNVGSGTAFSILPTYRKVATWYRVS